MKREETLKVLDRILQQREKDMEALQTAIDGLRIAIAEVERATDDAVTTPQKGTYKQELTDAMYAILFEYGPTASQCDIGESKRAWVTCWGRHKHSRVLSECR